MTSHGSVGHGSGLMNIPCDRALAALQPGHHGSHHHNAQLPLLALSLVLISGGAIQHFGSGIPLPYTVLLLLFGAALGAWVKWDPNFTLQPGMTEYQHEWDGNLLQCNVTTYVPNDLLYHGWHFGNSLRLLAEMDPHLLLHALLPPLLFESAFAIDWHIFEKVYLYALFLAVPGLVFCTTATGLLYMGMYGWAWESAMLLGGILSATDPVAVVALLREMGVKKSLATLIEAESLLNDGTAVVVYSILLQACQSGGLVAWLDATSTVGAWHIVWVTVRMSVLGPLLGVALGIISCKWLQFNASADRDANVEVICTLAMPFLVFYLAETAFGPAMQMSGVLAVVCYGLVFASPFGKVCIDPNVEHFLHEFWGMVGHLINTLIFILSGALILLKLDLDSPTIAQDLAFGVISYLCMTIYRSIVMFGVIPLFRRGHYGYDWRDALTISWGGLRGAVGLALAVSVFGDTKLTDETGMFGDRSSAMHFRQVVLVHCSLTVLLTLLINAPSSGPILKLIGLTKLSSTRVSMLQLSQRLLHKKEIAVLKSMANGHPVHADVSWAGCQRLVDFDAMVATIFGQQHTFNAYDAWIPSAKETNDGSSDAHAAHGAHHDKFEAVGCRARRVTKEQMGATASTPDKRGSTGNRCKRLSEMRTLTQLSEEESKHHADRGAKADKNWQRLHAKIVAVSGFAGDNFVHDFKTRLHEKRLTEAKYCLLEQLKVSVWGMYTHGQIRAQTASNLKQLVMEQIDLIETNRGTDTVNALPFDPMRKLLQRRPVVLQAARRFNWLAEKTVILSPLATQANKMLFREFENGYDAVVGYLLAHEEVLAHYDHGHSFSLDKKLDAEFKVAVKANIASAIRELAVLRLDWPQLCTALNTFRAARLVLHAGKELIDELGHHGSLHETETGRLLDMIDNATSALGSLNPKDAWATPAERDAFSIPESIGKKHSEKDIAAAQAALEAPKPKKATLMSRLATRSTSSNKLKSAVSIKVNPTAKLLLAGKAAAMRRAESDEDESPVPPRRALSVGITRVASVKRVFGGKKEISPKVSPDSTPSAIALRSAKSNSFKLDSASPEVCETAWAAAGGTEVEETPPQGAEMA